MLAGISWARVACWTLLAAGQVFSTPPVSAADIYDRAVQAPGRTAADLSRDSIDHPAAVLRMAGIAPGMQVADVLAGDGYYSELASYIVGTRGHVLLLNNTEFDHWSNNGWAVRLRSGRLPNVEHRTINLDNMQLGTGTLDAVLLIKVYHDLYWIADDGSWPPVNASAVLDQISAALKPGGVLLLVDHSAKPGTGKSDAGTLHRIDEAFARTDIEAHGFHEFAATNVLRRADDFRDKISYEGPMLGKTDRFAVAFRKTSK